MRKMYFLSYHFHLEAPNLIMFVLDSYTESLHRLCASAPPKYNKSSHREDPSSK